MRKTSPERHQFALIVLAGIVAVSVTLIFGAMAVGHFSEAERAWEEHNRRATAIGQSLAVLQRHIGYGGFIHNFKNLVLRRDLARYRDAVERDLVGLKGELRRLDDLLRIQVDRDRLEDVRDTFSEYESKYRLVEPMILAGKDSSAIDAVVKVSDDKALAAIAHLVSRADERAREAEATAAASQRDAMRFLQIGGLLVAAVIAGAVALMIVFLRRIVAANEAARKIRAQLDTLLDTSPDPMISVAADGRIVRANHMAESYFGYGAAEFAGMTVEQLIPERYRPSHIGLRSEYFAHPRPLVADGGLKLAALRRNGEERTVELSLSLTGDGADKLATVTVRDVTEREEARRALEEAKLGAEAALAREKQMQGELVRAEKMAALGGLTAGIAHEINTPIGVALTSATHLEAETGRTDRLYRDGELTEEGLAEYFDTACQAARLMVINTQRASDLIQSFKKVAVDQTSNARRLFELRPYIDEVLLSLRPRLKKSPVVVTVDCPPGLTIDGFPGALSQVLANLVTNALTHAFDPGQEGRIVIAARCEGENGDEVELTFRDDGKGIPQDLQEKVFEPFFTTRRSSGGSGLGLHIVYNIVHQTLRGSLRLESPPGGGAAFIIRFPRSPHA